MELANINSNVQTLSGQLSWSHYCELLAISDKDARNFYEQEPPPGQTWNVAIPC